MTYLNTCGIMFLRMKKSSLCRMIRFTIFYPNGDNANRQLALFAHTGIPEEQEREIIANLETNHIRWVVESNRSSSEEFGMGTFGETHCVRVADYLRDNFEVAAQFGDWSRPPGWAWNHGVRILKRKPPLQKSGSE